MTMVGILLMTHAPLGQAFIAACAHVFRGIDMQPRDSDGLLPWPCSKCGKVFRMEYGLLAPGEITGPWGPPTNQRESA